MKKLAIGVLLLGGASGLWAQQGALQGAQQAAPQTARQALLEMFFSKTPGTFARHLPEATREAMRKAGADSSESMAQYSLMASLATTQAKNLQTFDTGSILLSTDDPKTQQKVEVVVENDALRGDEDDLELSFHVYKNGELQKMPVGATVTFAMKTEQEVWKLNEVSTTIRLPLTDPSFLKMVTDAAKARAVLKARSDSPAAGSSAVKTAMRTILTAEASYANKYRGAGYTCSLSDLGGFGSGEPNEHQAMLIDSGLAAGKRYGYIFKLSGCTGRPATTFRLTVAPGGDPAGGIGYCADQSGVIRLAAAGNTSDCLASGIPTQ